MCFMNCRMTRPVIMRAANTTKLQNACRQTWSTAVAVLCLRKRLSNFMGACSVNNCGFRNLKEFTCSPQRGATLFQTWMFLEQLFFIICFTLVQSSCKAHIHVCTCRNSLECYGSSCFKPSFLLGF